MPRFEYKPRLLYTDEQGRTRFIHPDFYLYEHGLYVEYWGRDDPEYVESRRFKEGVCRGTDERARGRCPTFGAGRCTEEHAIDRSRNQHALR